MSISEPESNAVVHFALFKCKSFQAAVVCDCSSYSCSSLHNSTCCNSAAMKVINLKKNNKKINLIHKYLKILGSLICLGIMLLCITKQKITETMVYDEKKMNIQVRVIQYLISWHYL